MTHRNTVTEPDPETPPPAPEPAEVASDAPAKPPGLRYESARAALASEDEFDESLHDENAYKVSLDIFEGPMDLLLYLIKRDEIDIYDIPIIQVTKDYMSYLDTFKMLNIGLAGEFLVMAANLCYIKSRMMLPRHVQPPEEDADEEDPRWDLIRQLIEYKKFKEAAKNLGEREAKQQNHFTHKPAKIVADQSEERPLSSDVSVFDLIRAFQNILDRFNDEGLGEIVDDHYTVSDKIDLLLEKVAPGGSISFFSLFVGATSKHEMIVTFLAVLELMKLNYFKVRQEAILGEIVLQRHAFESQNPL